MRNQNAGEIKRRMSGSCLVDNRLSYIQGPVEPKVGEFKYSGICKGLDGKLYCAPQCAPNVMVVDPAARAVSFISGQGLDPESPFKYSSICLGPDGKLYCSPFGAQSVLVIDTSTKTFSNIGRIPSGQSLHSAICLGPNNNLFCSPEMAHYALIVKPETEELEFITGNGMEQERKYLGICAGPDGSKLYCAPYCNDAVLEIDPRQVLEVAKQMGGSALVEAFRKVEPSRQQLCTD